MSNIDTASISNSENITKTISTNFSKKQAWLKELEHARQISSYNKDGESGHNKETSAISNQSTAGQYSAGTTTNLNTERAMNGQAEAGMTGVDKAGSVPVKINTVAYHGSKVLQADINAMGRTMPSARPVSIIANRVINIQQLETSLKAEFKLQNIKLIPDAEGVRIMFRDYRLDSRAVDDVVARLKRELKDLGIPVLGVVVNGIQFAVNKNIV